MSDAPPDSQACAAALKTAVEGLCRCRPPQDCAKAKQLEAEIVQLDGQLKAAKAAEKEAEYKRWAASEEGELVRWWYEKQKAEQERWKAAAKAQAKSDAAVKKLGSRQTKPTEPLMDADWEAFARERVENPTSQPVSWEEAQQRRAEQAAPPQLEGRPPWTENERPTK